MPQLTPCSVSTLTIIIYILSLSWTQAFLTGFRFNYFTQSHLEQQPAWGPGTTQKKTLLIEQTHLLYTHRFNYFLVVSFQSASKAIPIWNTKQHWKLFRGYHFLISNYPQTQSLGRPRGIGLGLSPCGHPHQPIHSGQNEARFQDTFINLRTNSLRY